LLAGFFGLTGVAAGAWGWHDLGADDAVREIFMMGVSYQLWHSLALLAVAWLSSRTDMAQSRLPTVAGIGFSAGIVLFSGTLYAFAVTGIVPFDGAAPAGGFALMAGWGSFIVYGWKVMRTKT
jgi:uncharacterized membrane protein YgdD (TMEM256/DUF423 family)